MRGIVLSGPGLDGLIFADLPEPVAASGEVVVRLKAAALNHRDLWCCRGWQGTDRSAVLGSDRAGVIDTSRDANTRRRAVELGADLALDSAGTWAEQVIDFAAGAGADVVIENIGRPSWAQSLASLGRGGRLVVYGSTGGDVVETDLVSLFLNWRSISGTTMGNAAEFTRMVDFAAEHRIVPIVDRVFPFSAGIQALHQLDKGEQFGKIVVGFE